MASRPHLLLAVLLVLATVVFVGGVAVALSLALTAALHLDSRSAAA